jgi:hypothetical protein
LFDEIIFYVHRQEDVVFQHKDIHDVVAISLVMKLVRQPCPTSRQ